MAKKEKRKKNLWYVILWLILIVINLIFFGNSYMHSGIKQKTCKIVGCPDGPRRCADINAGPVTIYCYEKPPKK